MSVSKQSGMGMLSMIFIILVTGIVVLAALKLFPVFYDFSVIKTELKSVESLAQEEKMGRRDIWNALSKRLDINNIDYLTEQNLVVDKSNGDTRLSLNYEARPDFIGNVGFVVKFDTDQSKP
ncbi:MAG: DUF4845 domain-containing protein [Thiotrichales bacterium]